jgi:hypothetical protein
MRATDSVHVVMVTSKDGTEEQAVVEPYRQYMALHKVGLRTEAQVCMHAVHACCMLGTHRKYQPRNAMVTLMHVRAGLGRLLQIPGDVSVKCIGRGGITLPEGIISAVDELGCGALCMGISGYG